jgi:hypothetical protein
MAIALAAVPAKRRVDGSNGDADNGIYFYFPLSPTLMGTAHARLQRGCITLRVGDSVANAE